MSAKLNPNLVEMTQFRDNAVASLAVAMSQVGYFKGLCMAHGIAYEDSKEALGDIVKGVPGNLENK